MSDWNKKHLERHRRIEDIKSEYESKILALKEECNLKVQQIESELTPSPMLRKNLMEYYHWTEAVWDPKVGWIGKK